jgi:hypothetical protein
VSERPRQAPAADMKAIRTPTSLSSHLRRRPCSPSSCC